ncbi:MAG: cytochrome c oxidase subunit 3 [Proteobacteria bacterium]|nr:cytochrome c oxidase subunit 3 [Pseudomonadota bacterium]
MAHAHAPHASHKHPYHLVDPSPWPILGALAAFTMFVGLLVYMHYDVIWLFLLGVAAVLAVMFAWFRDVVREATFEGHHTPVVQIGLRYGMALFIASEVMFFAAFFWAFFDSSLFPAASTGGQWPPQRVTVFNPWELPFLNTLILLSSGCTVTWAHHALIEDKRAQMLQGLGLTIALGLTFLLVQAYEYSHAPFSFKDGIYSSTFFMATGFHGFHVMIGTVFLSVCLYRAWAGHFKPDHHFGFEAAAWYWHFVDVVWLFLFVCVYWWGGSGAPRV